MGKQLKLPAKVKNAHMSIQQFLIWMYALNKLAFFLPETCKRMVLLILFPAAKHKKDSK